MRFSTKKVLAAILSLPCLISLASCGESAAKPADSDTTADRVDTVTTAAQKKEAPVGEWIDISPEGAVSALGEKWTGYLRVGSEPQNVIVCFYGGGVAMDDASANPDSGLYFTAQEAMPKLENGFFSRAEFNPFRNWTVIAVPYTTGDFHTGTGVYTTKSGNTVHFNGYNNYRSFLDEAVKYVTVDTDRLLITGASAGGFGTALLSRDVIDNYFPNTKNIVSLVDSGFLLYDGWHDTAKNLWNSPDDIADKLTTDDITLDSLRALSAEHPEVKILFTCSSRDSVLCLYQGYAYTGTPTGGYEGGAYIQDALKKFADGFVGLPNSAILIWNDYYGGFGTGDLALTQHTITFNDESVTDKLKENGKTVGEWTMEAFEGKLSSAGTELLIRGKTGENAGE